MHSLANARHRAIVSFSVAAFVGIGSCSDLSGLEYLAPHTYETGTAWLPPGVTATAEWSVLTPEGHLSVTFRNSGGVAQRLSFLGYFAPTRLLVYDGAPRSDNLVYSELAESPAFFDTDTVIRVEPGASATIGSRLPGATLRRVVARTSMPVGVVVLVHHGRLVGVPATHDR